MLSADITTNDTGTESGSKTNIFIDNVAITSASDVTESEREAGFQHDAAVRIKADYLSPEKSDWSRTITIGGKFRRDETGKVVEWGGAFKVRDLFQSAGVGGEIADDEGLLNQEKINALIGKEVKMLSYVSSRTGKTKVWNHVTKTNRNDAEFTKYFMNQVKGGWVKDFQDPNAAPQNGVTEANDVSGPWDDTSSQQFQQDFI